MSEPTRPDLVRLKELEAKATATHWESTDTAKTTVYGDGKLVAHFMGAQSFTEQQIISNCELGVAARNAISDLIRWIEHLESRPCASCEELRKANERMSTALTKINAIRNSLIACQGFNFSEHGYPLVAALNEAGIEGQSYDDAVKDFGTLIQQRNAAREEIGRLKAALSWADEHLVSMNVLRDIAGNRIEIIWRKKPAVHSNMQDYGSTVLEALQSGLTTLAEPSSEGGK